MEIEFNDILNEFESDVRRENNANTYSVLEFKKSDFKELITHWINERMSPELLPYPQDLITRILDRLQKQIEIVELNSVELQVNEKDIKLKLMIIESEIERINYLVRSYLRTRLSKIDKYTIHIKNNESEIYKLSSAELKYMEAHFQILVNLYNNLFLKNLPESLQYLDDNGGGLNMIEPYELDKPVFIRVLKSISEVILIDNEEELELEKDGIYLVRYSAIQKFVHLGDVVLI